MSNLLLDVQYAIGQLEPMLGNPLASGQIVQDRVQRALDALDRVETELNQKLSETKTDNS